MADLTEGGYIYRSCVHFLQFWTDSLQNWRSPGSNVSKKIPSSVAALIPGRLPKNRLRRRKDGCFRVSGNAQSRFLASNVHVRASVRSPGYPEAVGGYPGLIRSPDHLADNAKPRFRPERARDSKKVADRKFFDRSAHWAPVDFPMFSMNLLTKSQRTAGG